MTWVRAFKFIFGLWDGLRSGSFAHVLKSFSYFMLIDHNKITPKLIVHIRNLSERVFEGLTDLTIDKTAVDIINIFNNKFNEPQFSEIHKVLGSGFRVTIFDENDKDDLITEVSRLNWQTSYKLFKEVFSAQSRYMTVHQAKGLEWDKVVVSLIPNSRKNRDNTTLAAMFQTPQLMNEESSQEFTRMYYVACSRAKEDLYIHLPCDFDSSIIEGAISNFSTVSGQHIDYEFIVS